MPQSRPLAFAVITLLGFAGGGFLGSIVTVVTSSTSGQQSAAAVKGKIFADRVGVSVTTGGSLYQGYWLDDGIDLDGSADGKFKGLGRCVLFAVLSDSYFCHEGFSSKPFGLKLVTQFFV